MAAEGSPTPSSPTPGPAAPPMEAAPPAVEVETPQDPSRSGFRSAAHPLRLAAVRGSAATRQGESRCSEEFVLNRTFAVCDPEQTGTVTAQGVVEYLEKVTGQSGEEGQLQALHRMLDPEAAGTALDLPTFNAIMREWIASCRQEGSVAGNRGRNVVPSVPAGATNGSHLPRGSQLAEERDAAAGDLGLVLAAGEGHAAPTAAQLEGDGGNADIASPTETAGLRSRAEQLATQNAKLQQDAESAEELIARLAEETTQLKAQLRWCGASVGPGQAATLLLADPWGRLGLPGSGGACQCPAVSGSSQQALEQARAAAEELEDLKAVAKGLEEENGELRRQAHQMEKEQRCLCLRADGLQEENQQLLAESHGLRERIRALAAETTDLEAQLRRCTALLSSRDVALAQAGRRVEELTVALEEYDRAVQELRQETTRLREQLGRMQDAWAVWPWCPLSEADVPAQPLGAEIEAARWGEEEEAAAPRPLTQDGEELAKPLQRPGRGERLPPPLALLALLALLVLLALLCRPPRRWLGLPHGAAAWPQLQLCYRRPPPL
ncbi:protein KASH5 isoform X3 [Grus americana]|uniref:protein KASH5 isoform X3 n=1 Tax=Grus americana TaxID=9117 RepID=UPI002407ED62|nr:protein KASH5 isoform X3 [Grus americana]